MVEQNRQPSMKTGYLSQYSNCSLGRFASCKGHSCNL